MAALNETYAISRATRCKQFLFSLSLNPPKSENVSTETFEQAIDRAEEKLGLNDQPRATVFHEKNGRRHCHAVWSRIKMDEMKAVQLSFPKRKLIDLSRELFLEHGWTMPAGLRQSHKRDPLIFALAEWQQARRIGKDPKQIKAVFHECWSLGKTQNAFAHALKEQGYILARGDRRGFVAVDHRGEVFAVSKWVGILRIIECRHDLCAFSYDMGDDIPKEGSFPGSRWPIHCRMPSCFRLCAVRLTAVC